jgi:hypothetical protein
MSRFSQPLTQLIHENLSVLVTFAFSREPLELLRSTRFRGEWKYLDKALFVVSEQRADRACVELATLIRLLDDDEDVSGYLKENANLRFGRVVKEGQLEEPLYLRDLTNKIIHAHRLEWDFSTAGDPRVVCVSRQPERWLRAEIEIVALAGFCGQLMS